MKLTVLADFTLILEEISSRFISNSHGSSRCWVDVYIITLKRVIWFPRREATAAFPLISWTPSAPLWQRLPILIGKESRKTWQKRFCRPDWTEKNGRDNPPPPAYVYKYIYMYCVMLFPQSLIYLNSFQMLTLRLELLATFVSNHKWRKTAAISCQAYFSSAYWVCLMF